MTRLRVTVVLLATALALGGCATTGDLIPGGLSTGILSPASPQAATPSEVMAPTTVSKVQSAAAKVCGYVPAVTTVTALLSVFIRGAPEINNLATSVAESICKAVVPKRTLQHGGRLVARPPSMMVQRVGTRTLARPVPVEGAFVR